LLDSIKCQKFFEEHEEDKNEIISGIGTPAGVQQMRANV